MNHLVAAFAFVSTILLVNGQWPQGAPRSAQGVAPPQGPQGPRPGPPQGQGLGGPGQGPARQGPPAQGYGQQAPAGYGYGAPAYGPPAPGYGPPAPGYGPPPTQSYIIVSGGPQQDPNKDGLLNNVWDGVHDFGRGIIG